MIDSTLSGVADYAAPENTPAIQKTGNSAMYLFNSYTENGSLQRVLTKCDASLITYGNIAKKYARSIEIVRSLHTALWG